MIKTLIIFIFILSIYRLSAEDSFEKMYEFSENVRDVILASPAGNPMPEHQFQLSTEQSDQVKAISFWDDSLREHLEISQTNHDCNKNTPLKLEGRVAKRDFQIKALVLSSDTKFEQNALGRFMSDDYISYMGQLYQSGNFKSWEIYSIDSLVQKYKIVNPKINFDKLKFIEKEKKLNEFAGNFLGKNLPTGLLMKELAFQEMIKNSTDWKIIVTDAKNVLSSQQKIELVSKLGGYFGNNYNYARAQAGLKVSGEYVNMEQLLNSVKNGNPGGICRDIALAQAQLLKELGFVQNYVVAYKTLSDSHATVVTVDPVTGKIIKFNYNETNESQKGSGAQVLTQDTSLPDHGLGFRIYDTNGKPVTRVSSELSQMLKEATESNSDREFTPRNFSLINVGFKTPVADGSLFSGKTSSGETLYGVSLFKNGAANDYLSLGAGASVSKLTGNRSTIKIDQDNLYLNANIALTSPSINLGKIESKIFANVATELLISNNKESSLSSNRITEAKKEIDSSANISLGVQNNFKSSDGKTEIENKVYASFYPEWEHVAKLNQRVAALDTVVVKTGVTKKIDDDTRALVDAAIVLKNYGSSLVIKAALEDEKKGARYIAGASVPVSKNMPTFLPGGEKRAFVGVDKKIGKTIFSILYERNFDNNSNNIMLKGEAKF
ncbi:MAG: hypothetical protein Q7U04_12765 [Bacteriovorax sp.]|nr:hypothetical protein [Bacteriovorax sp.]